MGHSITKSSKLGYWSSIVAAIGVLLSGPIAIVLVSIIAPQPRWRDVETFVENFHRAQSLPYFFGLLLVGGAATMVICLAERRFGNRQPTRKALTTIVIAVFVTLISLNYIVQTTFVPALCASSSSSSNLLLVEHLTLSNPRSLGWALEMWGYAFLGLGTWTVAPRRDGARWCRRLLIANGVVSIAGGFLTAWRIDWVFSTAGYVSFAGWNLLMAAAAASSALLFRRSHSEETQRLRPKRTAFMRPRSDDAPGPSCATHKHS